MNLVIFTDGGSRGNPGIAGAGYSITKTDQDLDTVYGEVKRSDYSSLEEVEANSIELGEMTNNQAEWLGMLGALDKLSEMDTPDGKVMVLMDSELVIKQVKGIYKVKNAGLKPFKAKVDAIIKESDVEIEFRHIRREYNKRADELANIAMDAQG